MEELHRLDAGSLAGRLLAGPASSGGCLEEAVVFARLRHANQLRGDGTDFVTHPMRVGLILAEAVGDASEELLAGALLHDVVEDTDTGLDEVRDRFGEIVAGLVRALTLPPLLPGETRHRQALEHFAHLAGESREAQLLRCADRLDNLNTVEGVLRPRRLAEYVVETREGLLPLARRANPLLSMELHQALARHESGPRERSFERS